MIDELKSNVTLHPISTTRLQTVQTLSPRVMCCENFLREVLND